MSSLVTALAFPRATISVEGIPLFHFENAFLAKEAPRLARFVLDAVHHRMFTAAVHTNLGFAHGSQAWLHILEPFVGKKVGSPRRKSLWVEPGVFDTPLKTLVITGDFPQNEVLYPRLYPR